MRSTDSINIASGGNITLEGLTLSTDGDIFLNSIKDISLIPKNKIGNSYTYNTRLINHEGRPSDVEYSPTGFAAEDFGTRIFTKNGIISSGGNIFGNTVQINTKNNLLIRSGNNIKLAASDYENRTGSNATNKFETTENISISNIHTSGNLTLSANNVISMVASKLSTGGDMNLSAGGDMNLSAGGSIGFEAANVHTENFHISKSGGFSETISDLSKITPRTVELSSSKNLSILTEGNILFQATKLMAKGAMNIAAKGGYLYAQAQEDISHYTTKSSSRNWYGKKKTSTHVHHEVHNRVTEFIAEGDINLLSHDDSTYEASKIETSKNATLTSTHGKINFKAVKDTIFDQVISQSKGFFIKNQDKGYSKETWVLPSVHIGGKLTIEATEGITADVKVKNKEILQNTLDIIGNTPETAWLKELSKRQDVHWNEVQDAYSSWNYENKSLNPVVSAAIAIAVAAVTAGAGLTLTAAGSAATTAGNVATAAGASATTAATVSSAAYGAVQTGMAALASKAAVSLINNEGDLSKTLKDMGNSKTVKSIATSMVIGGALSGFDQAMGWTQAKNGAAGAAGTNEARLPLLSNKDWIQTAQRVAGQSIISSSLNTAINRGSFKDNFTTALLSTTANQIHAEGAHQIGNYFDSKQLNALEEAGRAISHAGLSALAAEISGSDAKGAAAGALATSLAYAALGNTFEDPLDVQASGKIIGGVAGAFISNSAAGAYSGADAGEITIIYNGLAHSLAAMKAQDPEAIKNWEKGVSETCSPNPQLCQEAAKIVAKEASEFIPGYGDIKAFHDAETTNDYLVATLGIFPAAKVVKVLNKLSKAVDAGDVKTAKKIITEAKTEAVSVKYFGQDRKYWKDEPISFEHGNVKNKVYQRNDLFDPHAKDPKGRTNIERMKTAGLAPVGADGKSITLHHMTQKHTGPIAEINQEFHSKNTKVIHVNTNKIPSGIDRNKFNKWKREYWKERAKEFEDKK
ncbi:MULTISPECIES: DUF637 domain-containing protein [unclassified Photorhabdus]|uniref:DUF637 domain-containing protein n=1 Tax=unclassified Photorhabdus TaxID=2620880 RepID=UPI000DCE4D2B|nr:MULTISPECIES: DUF637 domain-containing protein [unclassified Photorhabdus]RAW94387.1 hypothetical protein CKY03_20095 [Photorhabdus sp. S9-53]RAW94552.1 hypothetical protein CKY05_19885 [Photorhabdus sp. S10-54]RAW98394.1 hypothetical protein CKY04_19595 [Photorhabdus sp. S8-52]